MLNPKVWMREHGQIITIAALLIPILLGMSALAVDVGTYAADRRELQKDTDAIALAAAKDLPNVAAVQATANSYASKNHIDPSLMTVSVTGGTTAPRVTVTLSRSHSFSFIKLLGVSSATVGGRAAAELVSPGGVSGVLPWAITQDTVDNAVSGQSVTIKNGGGGGTTGNYGAIDFDGSGSSIYRDSVKYGSQSIGCSTSTPNCSTSVCPGTFPTSCAENAPSCDGPDCDSETGNMSGPTDQGVSYRISNTSTQCDTFDQVFTQLTYDGPADGGEPLLAVSRAGGGVGPPLPLDSPPKKQPTDTPTRTNTPIPSSTPVPTITSTPTKTNTAGPATSTSTPGGPTATSTPVSTPTPGGRHRFSLSSNCNPWGGGKCPQPDDGSPCSRRLIIIPIVNDFGNGKTTVTILGFALFWLESSDHGDVTGRFVDADVNLGSLAAAYDPNSNIHYVKLVE